MTGFTENFVNPVIFGGDKRDRTADLLNAIQALSQLSYTPMSKEYITRRRAFCQAEIFSLCQKSSVRAGMITQQLYSWYTRTMGGIVMMHSRVVRTFMEQAYSASVPYISSI